MEIPGLRFNSQKNVQFIYLTNEMALIDLFSTLRRVDKVILAFCIYFTITIQFLLI